MSNKKITIPLVLGDNEQVLKVGKVNDSIVYQNCSVSKKDSAYHLIEKRKDKNENKFLGTSFLEQTTKYVLFEYNPSTNRIQVYPACEWYLFKKDFEYKNLSKLEDAEEKMKSRINAVNVLKRKKEDQPTKKDEQSSGRPGRKKKKEDDEELPEKSMGTKKEKEDAFGSDYEHSSENDVELKSISSDLEEFGKDKTEKEEKPKYMNKINHESEEEEEEEEESDDDFANQPSEVDEEGEIEESFNKKLLGGKRERDEEKTTFIRMCEALGSLLAKNKHMTYERIVKEINKDFSTEDTEKYLKSVLDKMTKMFNQNGETYYFKKND